jgi:asparagine synthetase B (glutamine-hydrolysing)
LVYQQYLFYQGYLKEQTLFSSVKSIEPGHFLKIDIGNFTVRQIQYWDFPLNESGFNTYEDCVDEFLELSREAISYWTIADVPVGRVCKWRIRLILCRSLS